MLPSFNTAQAYRIPVDRDTSSIRAPGSSPVEEDALFRDGVRLDEQRIIPFAITCFGDRARVVRSHALMVAAHIGRARDAGKTGIAENARERFEIVAILVSFKLISRLSSHAGVGEKVLKARGVFRPPGPRLTAAVEEARVMCRVGFHTLLDIGH